MLASLAALAGACGPSEAVALPADAGADAGDPARARARARALEYLATTRAELGLDVIAALQIVAATTGDPRAEEVAEARREGLSAEELAELGALLELPKPVLAPAELGPLPPPAVTPDPEQPPPEGAPDVGGCLVDALQCRLDASCVALAAAPAQWGYVLTHQAVWLLFVRWAGCAEPFDLEARRHELAAALVAEMRFDPAWSDLAAERVAMLGHLGFASEVEAGWIAEALRAQQPSGCWRLAADGPCHPHPTGVTLWALALAPR